MNCLNTVSFMKLVQETKSDEDWTPIENLYEKHFATIDVDYVSPSNPNESLLFLTCLKKKMNLVRKMILQNPNANFTRASHGKTIPLLMAGAEEWDLLKHVIDSDQAIDVHQGHVYGLNLYWACCNYKQWALVHKIHSKFRIQIDLAPLGQHPPYWLAANAREFKIINEMLLVNPLCALDYAPSTGDNLGKTALWFILHSQESRAREATINLFIFLNAPLKKEPQLPSKYIVELDQLKLDQQKIAALGTSHLIKTYPELSGFHSRIEGEIKER